MRILNPPKIKDVASYGKGEVFSVLSSDRGTAYLVVILDEPSKSGLREWCSCPATVECRHLKMVKESRMSCETCGHSKDDHDDVAGACWNKDGAEAMEFFCPCEKFKPKEEGR